MPGTVRLIDPRGGAVDVPEEDVQASILRGYRPETQDDVDASLASAIARGNEQSYQTMAGKANAFAGSFASAATLGMSDVARRALGDDMAYERANRAANSGYSTAGNITGAILPAIVPGGQFLPSGAVSRIAGDAASAIGATGGAARAIVGTATAGSIEGAAQSAGQYVSDVALGNKKLSAEAFLGEMGGGAFWGGVIGGGFGALERGTVAARRLFPRSEVTREAVQAAEQTAQSATTKAVAAGDEAMMAARRRLVEIRASNPAIDAAASEAERAWYARQAEAKTSAVEAKAAREVAKTEAEQARTALAKHKLTVAERKEAERQAAAEARAARGKGKAKGTPPDGVPVAETPSAAGAADEMAPTAAAPPAAGEATSTVSSAAPQTLEEAVHDAIAKADPEAEKLVQAMRDYSFSKSKLPRLEGENASGRTWRVKGHQGNGFEEMTDQQLAETTLGRINEALNKRGVTAAQREAVQKLMTPERLSALGQLERGEAKSMPWWFNKEHVFEGRTFKISDLVNSEDIVETRRLVHGVRSDLERYTRKGANGETVEVLGGSNPRYFYERRGNKMSTYADELPRVDQHGNEWDAELLHNIGVIGDFERANHNLAQALGPAAPPAAVAHAAEYSAAAAKADDATATAVARGAEHIDQATAVDAAKAEMAPPAATTPAPVDDVKAAADKAEANLRELTMARSNVAPRPPAAAEGKTGLAKLTDAASALEVIGGLEDLGLPGIRNIPVVGPLLSKWLKWRAASSVFKRFGGKIPASAEVKIATKAAMKKDQITAAIHRAMDNAAAVSRVAARRGPSAFVAALSHRQYDDGQRRKGDDPAELALHRADELRAAVSDEQRTRMRLRQQVRTSDPEVEQAIGDAFMSRARFLDERAPRDPRPPMPFKQREWKPSAAEVDRFARYLHYADNPGAVFDDMANGQVPLEGIETVKACYPELYQHAQMQALHALAEHGGDVPYDRRVAMSMVFDFVGDSTMSPAYLAAMQAGYAQESSPQQQNQPTPPQPGLSGDASGMVSMYATAFDQRAR